jgi:uncharacterized iron-regulated protein
MSATMDFQALAAERLREAIDAGRLTAEPSDEDIAVVTHAWREARRQQARPVMTDTKARR